MSLDPIYLQSPLRVTILFLFIWWIARFCSSWLCSVTSVPTLKGWAKLYSTIHYIVYKHSTARILLRYFMPCHWLLCLPAWPLIICIQHTIYSRLVVVLGLVLVVVLIAVLALRVVLLLYLHLLLFLLLFCIQVEERKMIHIEYTYEGFSLLCLRFYL